MKRILVPTDFTILGEYAFNIALKIADKMDAEICVLSVVQGPQDGIYSEEGVFIDDNEKDYKKWTQELEQSKSRMSELIEGVSVKISTKTVIGKINKVISNYAVNDEVDMIVMGTSGSSANTWLSNNSHTEFMINHSKIPILTLKCDRSNLDLSQVVLVGDFLRTETMNLVVLKQIQQVFDSEIVMLKIATSKQQRSDEQILLDMQLFAKTNNLDKFSCHIYKAKTVEAGISAFSAEKNIDLIAIGTHQRSGVSKLFRHSVSDELVNNLFHPILTFPIT